MTKRSGFSWITRRLHNRMARIAPFRDGPFTIILQAEIPSRDVDAEMPGGRIDLFVPPEYGFETYFAIEAKRLRFMTKGRIIAGNHEYVKNGMMRFIAGQYAPFVNAGAMLGYVFDGNAARARSGVDKYVRGKSTMLCLTSPGGLTHSDILSDILPDRPVDETRHDLRRGLFTLFHIFLPV